MLMNLPHSSVEMLVGQLQTVSPDSINLLLKGMIQTLELWEWSLASHCCLQTPSLSPLLILTNKRTWASERGPGLSEH